MLIGILTVLVFLFCVATLAKLYSRLPRQIILLIASYALYVTVAGRWFALLLLCSTTMNFLFGRWVQSRPTRTALSTSIVANVLLLTTFKYMPEVALGVPSLQSFAHIALPLGISFWTFQAMSYIFDQYRGEELDPSFVEFALYMAFFPTVISGPICRLPEMLPQFRSDRPTRRDDIGGGIARIATGVLMMRLAALLGQGILAGGGITNGFDHLNQWGGWDVWCLAFGFGLQLFFDFAGYSHIAIGAAQTMGLTVPENFARPLQSTTPSVFWTRWHMSLSFWIRDFVFLPLAVMRREMWWRNLVLVVSMILFGIWHKATVLFVLWGCYHGVLLILHRQIQQLQRTFDWNPPKYIWTALAWLTTMCLINLGWIFFRANSLSQAQRMVGAILSPASYGKHYLSSTLGALVVALGLGYAAVLFCLEILNRHTVQGHDRQIAIGAMGAIARNRWYWLPPLYVLALLFVLLVTLTRGDGAAQLMYRGF